MKEKQKFALPNKSSTIFSKQPELPNFSVKAVGK